MSLLLLLNNREARPSATLPFTSALPAGFTFVGGATATYRDSDGKWQKSATNTPRFDHEADGTPLGIIREEAATNKLTVAKINPADTTNLSATGTAFTLEIVTDAVALAAAGLEELNTGNVYHFKADTGTCVLSFEPAVGNLNPHSYAIMMRVAGGLVTFKTAGNEATINVSNAGYEIVKLENVTPNSTARKLQISCAQGREAWFIMPQMVEKAYVGTFIVNETAEAVSRTAEQLYATPLTALPYLNTERGTIILDADFFNVNNNPATNPFLIASTDQNFTDTIGMETIASATRRKTTARYYVDGASATQENTGDIGSITRANVRYPFATSWIDGVRTSAASGASVYKTDSVISTQTGLDRIYLGGRSSSSHINGHIRNVKFFKQYLTPAQMGKYMVLDGERVVPVFGQSLATGLFSAQSGSTNEGEMSLMTLADTYWDDTVNWFANAGTAGTSLLYIEGTSTDGSWWYNLATGAIGTPFQRAIDIVRGCSNGTFEAFAFVNGQSDAGSVSKQNFMDGMVAVRNILAGYARNTLLKSIIVPIGSNTDELLGYQVIAEAQQELCSTYPTLFYKAPEIFDLALSDDVHPTAASNTTIGTRLGRKLYSVLGETVTGGVNGAAGVSAVRSGTTVVFTATHDGGTDFTGTEGFRYFNGADYNATENTIVSTTKTDVDEFTIELTDASAGTLYFALGSVDYVTKANLIKDNSAQALPLQRGKWTVT